MEQEIMEKQQETTARVMKQSPSSNHLKAIIVLLVKLAERRQAAVNSSTLVTFADDLGSYELADIDAACSELGTRRRAEGETAFPDLPTILEAVRGVIRARKPSPEQEAIERENARVQHFKDYPEDYLTKEEFHEFKDKIAAMCQKVSM